MHLINCVLKSSEIVSKAEV